MSTPNLDRFKPKPEALIRSFWFPEGCSDETGFRVWIRYTSPSIFGELEERIRTRFTKDRSRHEAAPATLRREVMNEVLLHTVQKCEGVTFGKLQGLCELDADAVAKEGGLDAPVPMDPTNPSTGEQGRLWLLKLLNECTAFAQWVNGVAQSLSLFQSTDWQERVKNSMGGDRAKKDGPITSSAPASETSPATV